MKRYNIYAKKDNNCCRGFSAKTREHKTGKYVKYDEANTIIEEFADLLVNPYDFSDRETDEIRERAQAFLEANK